MRTTPPERPPAVRGSGALPAELMLNLQGGPLAEPQCFSIDSDELRVSGFAQGDCLGVSFNGADVPTTLGRPAPGHAKTYWYVPGAGTSEFLTRVGLASQPFGTPDLQFTIRYEGEDDPLRRMFWIPPRLDALFCFPDAKRLTRVQTFDTAMAAAFRGYTHAMRVRGYALRHGINLNGRRVLDWGCGHGRVMRHLIGSTDVSGCDVDADNIAWADAHIPGARFLHVPLMPPTPIEDASVDVVYGISVMTHLRPEVQSAWLAEIRRVLRPGGLALLTIGADAAIAGASHCLTASQVAAYLNDEWLVTGYDTFDAAIDDPDYYKNVFVSHRFVRRQWSDHLAIEAIYPRAFGTQDLCVLRRQSDAPATAETA